MPVWILLQLHFGPVRWTTMPVSPANWVYLWCWTHKRKTHRSCCLFVTAHFCNESQLSISLAEAQAVDTEIDTFQNLKKLTLLMKNNSCYVMSLMWSYRRPFIPTSILEFIFDSIHTIAHPGIRAFRKMFKARYFGSEMLRQ